MSTHPQHAQSNTHADPTLAPELETVSTRHHANAVAFLGSLLLHVALLLILACWVYSVGKKSKGVLINARLDESEAFDLADMDTFEMSMREVVEEKYEEVEQDFKIDADIESLVEPASDIARLTSVSVDSVIDQLAEKTKGRGANFFGAYAQGNQFIYIIDSSRSMDGDRWLYARQQLLDSLKGLKSGQEFYVICFDHETTFLFGQDPQSAKYYKPTASNINRVRNWLRSRELGYSTMPKVALQYALNFKPDAIFLLSDGELRDDSQVELLRVNANSPYRRQIPIHTVHLFSRQGRRTLEMIAEQNNGSFTPIENAKSFNQLGSRSARKKRPIP
ncbi:MAG: hypothetical protein AAF483_05775 [Planctomycetota bacterium]